MSKYFDPVRENTAWGGVSAWPIQKNTGGALVLAFEDAAKAGLGLRVQAACTLLDIEDAAVCA